MVSNVVAIANVAYVLYLAAREVVHVTMCRGGVVQYVITPLLPILAQPRNAELVEEQRANVTRPANDDHLCLLDTLVISSLCHPPF